MLEDFRENSVTSTVKVTPAEKKKIDKALWVTSSAVR